MLRSNTCSSPRRAVVIATLGLIAGLLAITGGPATAAAAPVLLNTLGVPYAQSFDILPANGSATWTNESTIPGWFHALAEFQSTGTAVTALDFTSPITGGTAVALNGNLPANQVAKSFTITGLNLPSGSEIMLRWSDPDHTGSDHGLSIDDLSVLPNGDGPVNAPIVPTCPATLTIEQGTGTSSNFSAADTDGTVDSATITSATVAGISLDAVVPSTGTGVPLNGILDVASTTAVGVYQTTITFSNTDTPTEQTATCVVQVTVTSTAVVRIHDIQGPGHLSPFADTTNPTLDGQAVTNVPGVVTAVRSNGFYLQDPNPDADVRTSEGIFVFTSPPAAAVVGNQVFVSGTVTEFRPGCSPSCAASSAAADNLTITRIKNPTVTLVTAGVAVPVVTVGGSAEGNERTPPLAILDDDSVGGSTENPGGVFDPANDGLDFHESLEGMHISITDPQAVSRTTEFSGGSSQEIGIVPGDFAAAGTRTPRGGILYEGYNLDNPEVFYLADAPRISGQPLLPDVDVGDGWSGELFGVVDYDFNNFLLLPTQALPTFVDGNLQPEVTTLNPGPGQLTIATYNVENLDSLDLDAKFAALASQIIVNLAAPDIIVIEEIQDNDGPATAADLTWGELVTAITTAGGPTYQFRQIDPVAGQDGGEPGGNIRVGFLFRTDRGLAFVDRGAAGPTSPNSVQNLGGAPQLTLSPGRIDPTNPAFGSSRKPLVGEFTFAGETIFVVGNHWNSKGGDDPRYGRFQPPVRSSEVQRLQQAAIVEDFVDDITAIDPDANVVIAGDLNDYLFSPAVKVLTDNGYTSLVTTLPANERYGYVFDANSQILDHILVSPALTGPGTSFDTVHINAEFYDQQSDHDPSVARFTLGPTAPDLVVTKTDSPDPVVAGANLTYSITVANSVPTVGASLVTLGDVIPTHATFVSRTVPAGWNCAPQAVGSTDPLICTKPSLTTADGVQKFTLVVRVNLQTPSATVIANDAAVGSTTLEADYANNLGSTITTVTFNPSLPAAVATGVNWTLHSPLTTAGSDVVFTLGTRPLVPLTGDWDGNGSRTPGYFKDGTFNLSNSTTTSQPTGPPITFGDPRGFPVAGDFNGDGTDDLAVYRNGTWQVRLSTGTVVPNFAFGPGGNWPNTVPVAGDWNGDGIDGIGTYTYATGTWHLNNVADGSAVDIGPFVYWAGAGSASYPVVGDWNGDGIDTVGVVSVGSVWRLNNANDNSAADVTPFTVGANNSLPLTWRRLPTLLAE